MLSKHPCLHTAASYYTKLYLFLTFCSSAANQNDWAIHETPGVSHEQGKHLWPKDMVVTAGLFKSPMDFIYIAVFWNQRPPKAFYNIDWHSPIHAHIHAHIHTHRWCRQQCKETASSSGAVRMRGLAQGHLDTLVCEGAGDQTSHPLVNSQPALPPEPHAAILEDFSCNRPTLLVKINIFSQKQFKKMGLCSLCECYASLCITLVGIDVWPQYAGKHLRL